MRTELNKWVAEDRDEAAAKVREETGASDESIAAGLDYALDNAPKQHIFRMPVGSGKAGLWAQYHGEGEYLLWEEL